MTISPSDASDETRAADAQGSRRGVRRRQPGSLAAESKQTLATRLIVFLLCLTIVLSALAYGTVHTWALAVFYMGAMLCALLWLLDGMTSGKLRWSKSALQLPLLGAIMLGLMQLLPLRDAASIPALSVAPLKTLSLDPYATRFALVWLVALLFYFVAALVYINDARRMRVVVRTIITLGFLLAIFGMIQKFTSPTKIYWVRQPSQAVPFGPFINSHHFAAYMEMALALPLGLLFSGAIERERRPLYIFVAVVMGMALILTASRGGMLSLAAEIVFLAVISRRASDFAPEDETERKTFLHLAATRVGLALALLSVLLFGALFFGGELSLNRLLGTASAEDPTMGRTHFWATTLEIIRAHPVIGAGLGAYGVAYTRYDTWNGLYRVEQAHNDYLQVLACGGLAGALLGLWFLATLFRQGRKQLRTKDPLRRGIATGALAGCFAVLVHSFFDFPLQTTANSLLFLTLVALATIDGRPLRRAGRKRSTHLHRDDAAN
jgi:O-antigen ligase